jgi:hypothetical protein
MTKKGLYLLLANAATLLLAVLVLVCFGVAAASALGLAAASVSVFQQRDNSAAPLLWKNNIERPSPLPCAAVS